VCHHDTRSLTNHCSHRSAWGRFLLHLLLFAALMAGDPARAEVPFSFTLTQDSTTSAGVYTTDGVLVRTLWNNSPRPAAAATASWDGTDDAGNLLPDGPYRITVLSNNVSYTWEGVVGNTSQDWSGPGIHHNMSAIQAMTVEGTKAFFAVGYNEGFPTECRTDTTNPQVKAWVLTKGCQAYHVTSDASRVYWAGDDANTDNDSFVYATAVADDREITFQYGQAYKMRYGRTYIGAIDLISNTPGSEVTGLAVQRTGSYLFVSHAGLNRLDVLNKTTGQLVRSVTFSAPGGLACDPQNNLWILCTSGGQPVAQKFAVDAGGNLSLARTISGQLAAPLAIAVAPDGTTLLVTDGGSSQQVKAFDPATGSPLWTLGQPGGYATDPTVANDKFDFNARYVYDVFRTGFLAFQPDGSFWVGDTGNNRIQRYSASRQFQTRVMYVPTCYSIAADPNDPTRVFADYMEFRVDYSRPLAPDNGSWELVRNWAAGVPDGSDSQYQRMRCVTTLSNGRTYTLVLRPGGYSLYELPAAANLRNTGVTCGSTAALFPDGSLRSVNAPAVGGTVTWSRQSLTGFDASGNPQYSAATTMATAPATGDDPVWRGDTNHLPGGVTTSTGIIASFDHTVPMFGHGTGYHLGGVAVGGNRWLWKTSYNTPAIYRGPFPADGAFNIGNDVGNAGGKALTLDRSIIYGYYGENYRGSQTNKWNHYYDNGLMVGQFGVVGVEVARTGEAPTMMAGNAFSCSLVKLADGRVYLYHNDESFHSGVHRWRIDGLDTIAVGANLVCALAAASGGLTAEYFSSPDWNNRYCTATRVDGSVNFDWGADPPAGVGLTAGDNFSVRWTGFVMPAYSETYTFRLTADDYARLWVNAADANPVSALCEGSGTQSGSIALTAGIGYRLRLEYCDRAGAASVKLQWSSSRQPLQVIPGSRLHPAASTDDPSDLLAGLPYATSLADGDYGWTRSPAADSGTVWQALTNVRTYGWRGDRSGRTSPDLHMQFQQNIAATDTVVRDLGATSDTTAAWQLQADISYEDNYENHGTYGGQYLEILDDAGRAIFRMYPKQVGYPNDSRLYANDQVLVQDTQSGLRAKIGRFLPLCVSAASGRLTIDYGEIRKTTAALADPSANWRRPRWLRFYFWNVNAAYRRSIDVKNMSFLAGIPGDANLDCTVNILDLIFIRNRLGRPAGSGDNWKADANQDGQINILDLIYVRNKLNTKCP